jgi:cytochrome bd-type quinol oxidase subunit 1
MASAGCSTEVGFVGLPIMIRSASAGMRVGSSWKPWSAVKIILDGGRPAAISAATVITSLTVFVLVYAVLGVVDVLLMAHFARRELASTPAAAEEETPVLHFTY